MHVFFRAAREENAYSRMKEVVRWYLSGFYKKPKVSEQKGIIKFILHWLFLIVMLSLANKIAIKELI